MPKVGAVAFSKELETLKSVTELCSMQNFNPDLEREAQDGTEFKYGAVLTDLAAVPVQERLTYLPKGVLQFNNITDTQGCASRGPLNILETKLDYFYDHGMHPNIKQWFDDNGYRIEGKFALNDCFIEILSGTTQQGNSLKAPVDTVYRYGVIPAYLIPLKEGMTWEQYMDRNRITQSHLELGKQFIRRIGLAYEQVPLSQFADAVEDDLLDVALHAWLQPTNGVYPRTQGVFNHVVVKINNEIDAFDNYLPYIKRLAKDYIFFDWGYSLSVVRQTPYPDETITLFETLQKYGLLAFFARAIELLYATKPPVSPVEVPLNTISITPTPETAAQRLAEEAKQFLGFDASPQNRAPQELSCAEGVVNIVNSCWPSTLPTSIVSTAVLFETLKRSPRFKPTLNPIEGCIVVSPTVGTNIGHTGIYTEANVIASNDSRDGKFRENYTRELWRSYFVKKKGLKGFLFLPV